MIKRKLKTLEEVQNKGSLDEIERLRTLERLEHIRLITQSIVDELDGMTERYQRNIKKIDRGFKFFKWGLITFAISQIIITILKMK